MTANNIAAFVAAFACCLLVAAGMEPAAMYGYFVFCTSPIMHSLSGAPPQIASLAPQNGPSLIGPQEIRLVISFGPKVQGAPAYVASFGRVVRGARFEEREPWSFARYEQIEALYRHAPRVRISCAPPILFDDGDSIVKR